MCIILMWTKWGWVTERSMTVHHRHMGRVSFGGGGGWSLLPKYFFHCLHENQVVLPEYYLIFLPENGYLKNSRGARAPLSPMGGMPMLSIHILFRSAWYCSIRLTTICCSDGWCWCPAGAFLGFGDLNPPPYTIIITLCQGIVKVRLWRNV